MSVASAKAALAALLLRELESPTRGGVISHPYLLNTLKAVGHKETETEAALAAMVREKLAEVFKDDTRTLIPGLSPASDSWHRNRYPSVRPLPVLREWYDLQSASQLAPIAGHLFDEVEVAALEFLVQQLNSGRSFVSASDFKAFLETLNAGARVVAIGTHFVAKGILKQPDLPPYPEPKRALTIDNPETHRVTAWHQTVAALDGWVITGKAIEVLRRLTWGLATTEPTVPKETAPSGPKEDSQADTRTDTKKKKKLRGPRDIGELVALKKAIKRGERQGQSMRESAVEFTNGIEAKADSLLRKLRRHKDHPGLK